MGTYLLGIPSSRQLCFGQGSRLRELSHTSEFWRYASTDFPQTTVPTCHLPGEKIICCLRFDIIIYLTVAPKKCLNLTESYVGLKQMIIIQYMELRSIRRTSLHGFSLQHSFTKPLKSNGVFLNTACLQLGLMSPVPKNQCVI